MGLVGISVDFALFRVPRSEFRLESLLECSLSRGPSSLLLRELSRSPYHSYLDKTRKNLIFFLRMCLADD